jgi:hypothetical protein
MKFQAVLAAIFVAVISAKKWYPCHKPQKTQYADIDNKVDVDANAFALNAGFCGDATAVSHGNGVNYNAVHQNMKY